MSYLRFSPEEYLALSQVCGLLKLNRCRPNYLKRLLVQSLTTSSPQLAQRIGRFRGRELRMIRDHFRNLQHEQPDRDS
jgi:hypothetical protein